MDGLGQAAGVELFTPPLSVFGGDAETPQCLALNVSTRTLDVTLALFTDGSFAGNGSNNALPPLHTLLIESLTVSGRVTCRLTSAAGKPGDFIVTFCTMENSSCKVAVTAQ